MGKVLIDAQQYAKAIDKLQESIDKNKPSGSKGKYWKSLHLSSTMGPGIPIDINLFRDIK